MIGRRFAGADRGVLNQNIIFTGDLFQLIEQGRCFRRILERWLMLLDPLVTFYPKIPLFYVSGLLGTSRFARSQVSTRATQRAKEPTQNHEVEQQQHCASDNPSKQALARIYPFVPRRHHRGLPSNRNCAWSFAKIRGAAMSN